MWRYIMINSQKVIIEFQQVQRSLNTLWTRLKSAPVWNSSCDPSGLRDVELYLHVRSGRGRETELAGGKRTGAH